MGQPVEQDLARSFGQLAGRAAVDGQPAGIDLAQRRDQAEREQQMYEDRLNTIAAQRDEAEHVMRAVGLTRWVEEEGLLDAVTALSGSGPAYFFLVIEAMEAAARELGLTDETAHLLTLQTALGFALTIVTVRATPVVAEAVVPG